MAKDLAVAALLDYYGPALHSKPRYLMECYYNEDLSLAEIAENEGISRQGVHDAIRRAEAQLKAFESMLGFCTKAKQLRGLAAEYRKTGSAQALEALLQMSETL